MKKFRKLIVILALFIVAGAVCAVSASAADTAPFSVGGTEYTTFSSALAAADENTPIVLEQDFDFGVASVPSITKKVTIDLNGHTLKADGYNASGTPLYNLFIISGDLTITGEGRIESGRSVLNTTSKNAVATVNGTGRGITIVQSKAAQNFKVTTAGSSIALKGNIVIEKNPASNAAITLVSTGTNFNITDANIVYSSEESLKEFTAISSSSNISVTNSKIFTSSALFYTTVKTLDTAPKINISNSEIHLTSASGTIFTGKLGAVVESGHLELGSGTFAKNTHIYDSAVGSGILLNQGVTLSRLISCSATDPATAVSVDGFSLQNNGKLIPTIKPDHTAGYRVGASSEASYQIASFYNISTAEDNFEFHAPSINTHPSTTKTGIPAAFGGRYGILNVRKSANGNKYIAYTETIEHGASGNSVPYFYQSFGNVSTTSVTFPMREQSYYIYDFDFASESGVYPPISFSLIGRKVTNESKQKYFNPKTLLSIVPQNDGSAHIQFNGASIKLPSEKMTWTHITYIVEVAEVLSATKIHVYVDGAYLATLSNAFNVSDVDDPYSFMNGDKDNGIEGDINKISLFEMRVQCNSTLTDAPSFTFDNALVRVYGKGYTGDAQTGIAKFLENPASDISSCSDSIYDESYQYPFGNHLADVDGVPFDDFTAAVEAAVSKNGSTLTLQSDIRTGRISVPEGYELTVDLNGHSMITESMTEKISTFTVGKNAKLNITSSKPNGRIFNISYRDSRFGGAAIFHCGKTGSKIHIDGENISTYAASLLDFSGANNQYTEFTADGGHYYSTVSDSYGFIMNRGASATVTINNAVISSPSGASIYSTDSRYINGTSDAVFNNCIIIAKNTDAKIINQIHEGSTVSFNGCYIYGSLITRTEENDTYKHGSIIVDSETLFVGVPTFNSATAIEDGYRFIGVTGKQINTTLSYNQFFVKDGAFTDSSFIVYDQNFNMNFQTALSDAKSATVNWCAPDGSIIHTEEFAAGSIASYPGNTPIISSDNDWYDFAIDYSSTDTAVTEADKTYNFYPNLSPVSNISALQSITLYTGFDVNMYLPAPNGRTKILSVTDRNGNIITSDSMVIVNDLAYSVYTLGIGAAALDKDIIFVVTYTVTDDSLDGEPITATEEIKINILSYAKTILDGAYSAEEKTLAADMLRYAHSCAQLASGNTGSVYAIETVLNSYSSYLTPYPDNFGSTQVYTDIKPYVSSISFRLGSEVDYIFNTAAGFTEGMTINVTYESVNGKKITNSYPYTAGVTEYESEGIKVFDVTAILYISVTDENGNLLAKGYYSLSTYIRAVSATGVNVDFAKSLLVFATTAQNYRYPALTTDTVKYSYFGAVGDGECDDFFAIKSAHEFANLHGLKVKADTGAIYYIGDNGNSTIDIRTDTDWTGAEFILDDTNIPLSSSSKSAGVFKVLSDYSSFSVNKNTNSEIGDAIREINKNGGIDKETVTHLDLGLGYKAMLFVRNDTVRHYIRYGSNQNDGSAQTELILIDENGKIDENTPFMHDFNQISSIEIHKIDDTPITIKGGTITSIAKNIDINAEENLPYLLTKTVSGKQYTLLKNYTSYARGISISRSNTVIDGLVHKIENEGDYGPAYGSFLSASKANNVEFRNCELVGHRAYDCWGSDANGSKVAMGTYDIGASNSNDIRWVNCNQSNFYHPNDKNKLSTQSVNGVYYWGIMGSNYCKNLKYENSKLTRFDAHCGVYNASIINSEITVLSIIGGGTLLFENSKLITTTAYMVNLRSDYGSTFSGDVIIKDSEFRTTQNTSNVSILGPTYVNWNFGYTCYLPNSVTADNLKVTTRTGYSTQYTGSQVTVWLIGSSYASVDHSASTYNGAENINPIVPTKFFTIRNNKAGHAYKDISNYQMFASMPSGYHVHKEE